MKRRPTSWFNRSKFSIQCWSPGWTAAAYAWYYSLQGSPETPLGKLKPPPRVIPVYETWLLLWTKRLG